MKQVFLLMALLFGWVVGARADQAIPPTADGAISSNGLHVVRVERDPAREEKVSLSFHAYDKSTLSYQNVGSLSLETKAVGHHMFVSDDGDRVAMVYKWKGDSGIAIYGKDGLLKRWLLSELVSKAELGLCLFSQYLIQWCHSERLSYGSLSVSGPIIPWEVRWRYMDTESLSPERREATWKAFSGLPGSPAYSITVNVRNLTMLKTSLPKLDPANHAKDSAR